MEKMSDDLKSDAEILDKVRKMCHDCLKGAWKTVSPHEMVLEKGGGVSNVIYFCALPPMTELNGVDDEPNKVVARFYEQYHEEEAFEALLTETAIVTLLSEWKLGPKLYGVFPGGRIEEFIPARPLRAEEMDDPDISAVIAKKVAHLHTLNVPIIKEPTWLWDKMSKWLNHLAVQKLNEGNDVSNQHPGSDPPSVGLLEAELVWLKSYLTQLHAPVVFCHNDLNEGNILFRESDDGMTLEEKLVIIDFEHSSYNYRGYDIANYFSQRVFDFTIEDHPNFAYKPTRMPTEDQRMHFIQRYLEESSSKKEEAAHHLLREADCFVLANHYFWGLRALFNATFSSIPFSFKEYAEARLAAYFEHKDYVLGKYGKVINSTTQYKSHST